MNWATHFARRTRQMKRTAVRELLKLTAQPDVISFAGGLPAAELFPIAEMKEAAVNVLARVGTAALQYGESEGLAELRDWIAQQFSRPELKIERSHVAIVSGAQQALDLVGRILLNEGDKVIVENPTYLALLSAWRPLGVEFLPVASDENGMCLDELVALLEQRPKLIYSIPNFQNPQGTTLSAERRIQLPPLLRDLGVLVVEDDPYGELRYEGAPLPSLLSLNADTLYVSTFSKVLAPGLRVGWVIAPEAVIDKIVQAKQAVDLHTSTLSQHITLELVRERVLERQIPRLCRAYRERRDAMLAALENYFPNETTWTRPSGGMFLMVTIPERLKAIEVLEASLRQRVAFVPGDEFHLNGAGQNTFRLNFSSSPPARIEEGVKRLGNVLKGMLLR